MSIIKFAKTTLELLIFLTSSLANFLKFTAKVIYFENAPRFSVFKYIKLFLDALSPTEWNIFYKHVRLKLAALIDVHKDSYQPIKVIIYSLNSFVATDKKEKGLIRPYNRGMGHNTYS